MVKTGTVLILGAGASMPFGFPSGQQLLQSICRMLSHRRSSAWTMARQAGHRHQIIERFVKALSGSAQTSIDAFLEHRPEFVKIGKMMIAAALLPHERTDEIFDRPQKEGKPNWYEHLFGMLNTSFDEFHNNNIAFITFNYDRSLEHYIHTALCNLHGKPPNEVADKISSIPIVHVHGQLGSLPWQDFDDNVPFDSGMDIENVTSAAEDIKIIHDNIDHDPEFKRAQGLIEYACRIYFLGFGYNETNLKRLGGPELFRSSNKDVIGTGKGLSITQQRIAKEHFGFRYTDYTKRNRIARQDYLMPDCTCHDFIYNHVDLTRYF